jgi:ATP-binding cassette subfamily C protein CydCD
MFAITIALSFGGGILTVIQAYLLSQTIDGVFLNGLSLGDVSGLLWAVLGIVLFRAGAAWAAELSAKSLSLGIKNDLRARLFQHIQRLGPAYLQGTKDEQNVSTGELINTVTEGVESLDAYYSQYLPSLALAALIPLAVLVIIFPIDILSGLVLLFTAPLIPIFMVLIGVGAEAITQKQWKSLSRMSAYFLDVIQGLTTLKIFGRSRQQAEVIARISDQYRQTTMGVLRVTFLSALVLEMVATLSTAVIAVEIGLRLLYGQLPFVEAFFILLLAPEFYMPLRMLGMRFHAGMAGVAAAGRIFQILDIPTQQKTVDVITEEDVLRDAGQHSPEITFSNVGYAYSDEHPIIEDISFKLKPGEKTALVGKSGSGKSTIADLTLGFIQPAGGLITVDGHPLEDIPSGDWLDKVAWVPQNPYLFYGTIADNIRLSRPEASLDEMIHAAKLAHADEFINELPKGYDTVIGERGARLSGGQAQRIALARAFLKEAPILILDEPSSNLDPESEALIQESVDRLTAGRTTLTIAHRLNTVYQAEQIIVLADGRVENIGTHQELLSQDGLYKRMVTVQGISDDVRGTQEPRMASTIEPTQGTPFASLRQEPQTFSAPRPQAGPGTREVLKRLVATLSPYKHLVALSVLLGFATIASGIGLMSTSAYIISKAALGPSIAALQVPIVAVRAFGISRGVFRYLERLVSHDVTFRLVAQLRVRFYQALEPLAPARLMGYRSGDLLSRIISDINALDNFYVRGLAPPIVAGLIALVMWLFMYRFDPSLAFVLLACLTLAGIGVPILTYILSRVPGGALVIARARLNEALVDGIQGMADLKVYKQDTHQYEMVSERSNEVGQAQRRLARVNGMQVALVSAFSNLAMLAVLTLGITLVEAGGLDPVYLGVLALAALTCFEAIHPLPVAAQYMEISLLAGKRLFHIVDAQPEVVDPAEPMALPQDLSLEVEDLHFSYTGLAEENQVGSESAIDCLSLSLLAGKRIAIVGPSGAGKTTLVNTLLRFWEYHQGSIRLGGNELQAYNQDELRSMIGVVSQRTELFNASLRENLLIAKPGASQDEIERAVQGAQLHDFVQSLPDGYETWIGEGGIRMSAGERQRLSIARALLKDAPILILDEVTANLDTLTEREILDNMHKLMYGRTTLVTTHRLVNMETFDEILVLQEGRVVERGGHQDLLEANGLYRRMWDLQNRVLAAG